MANSEFKAALRTFYREKSYAVINLTGLSLAIACSLILGLYLRSELTYDQHHLRHKEIGIRKVLGASAAQIVMMLARSTLWLVLAGSIAASIITYYAIDEWLSGFAYRVAIHPLVFIVSAGLVIAVAFITIFLQSYKAAQANPALMIRYE